MHAGRLTDEQQFRDVSSRPVPTGRWCRLVMSRASSSARRPRVRSLLDNNTSLAIPVFPVPRGECSGALDQRGARRMEELKKNFPEGMDYASSMTPRSSCASRIDAVVHTLCWEAVLLVVLVVILFLQTWRASLHSLIAVPVSVIGSSGVAGVRLSINTLSLLGLVLAIASWSTMP